MSEVKQGTV